LDYDAGYLALRIKCSPFGQHDVRLRLHEENAGINTRFFVVFTASSSIEGLDAGVVLGIEGFDGECSEKRPTG
jgi:hypothetical protein